MSAVWPVGLNAFTSTLCAMAASRASKSPFEAAVHSPSGGEFEPAATAAAGAACAGAFAADAEFVVPVAAAATCVSALGAACAFVGAPGSADAVDRGIWATEPAWSAVADPPGPLAPAEPPDVGVVWWATRG
jgi:hypothetical protein